MFVRGSAAPAPAPAADLQRLRADAAHLQRQMERLIFNTVVEEGVLNARNSRLDLFSMMALHSAVGLRNLVAGAKPLRLDLGDNFDEECRPGDAAHAMAELGRWLGTSNVGTLLLTYEIVDSRYVAHPTLRTPELRVS